MSETQSMPAIEMRDVNVAAMRDASFTVVEDVDWLVAAGEFWVIAGQEHSGKSDLLMLASGLMPAAGGNSGVAGTVSAAVITQRKPKDTKTYCQEEFTKFFPGLPVLKVIQWYEFTTPKYSGADEGSAAHGTVTDDPNNPGSFLVTPISLPDTIVIVLLGS